LPLNGYGIRYKYGIFKQGIVDGFQTETADNWTEFGDPWSKRCNDDIVEVVFKDQVVRAIPYDMPIIGYGTNHIGTLRLWQAEPVNEFDFNIFNQQKYLEASKEKIFAEDISRVLYPNDDTYEGKVLRLKQQYFFSSASLTDLIKKHKEKFGTVENFADYNSIQLNDTHPVISIPELIRQLIDNEGLDFDTSYNIAKRTFNYTNHTIMAEALEKWDKNLVTSVIPRVYEIILMLNEQFIMEMYNRDLPADKIKEMKIVIDNTVHMAHMAIFCSSYTNGVARIHTEILKDTVLNDWYKIYPDRFQNKTNGITQRRWLALCNEELSSLITELLGSEDWVKDLDMLKELEKYSDNDEILNRFIAIKKAKKEQLAEYIKDMDGVEIDVNSIFDIQIKRLHEYKRQLLNALSILYIYFGIKDGSIKDFTPTTYIFGGKSAPGYRRAKGIIKFINEVSKLVNSDPETRDLIKVVFVSNYNVSYAEKLFAGADVSEQISTAGTEASGTGNMKFMLNGTVTLGTFDGANVEIVEEAGEDCNYIFGARVEDLAEIMPNYDPRGICENNEKIKRVVSTLIDGTVSDGGTGLFQELYFSLLDGASWHRADNYYLIGDLESYVEAKLRTNRDYKDQGLFAHKCWTNMSNAGKFTSDRTIKDYAENMWKIEPVTLD
ncbi:MAG: glycogen/starch/alpha-glucan phosphorylase, partial [Clostridiales bacterium]|nr:glycogen/starch/alpha-glucan phosphorylase [Clostridiales bacterium]